MRGLKLNNNITDDQQANVAPYVGAWVETIPVLRYRDVQLSHLTWVRGLKQRLRYPYGYLSQSHLTWVRGLKHNSVHKSGFDLCRTLRGCVG